MIIDTHYDILNVTMDAPDDLIRAVYLVLARKYHPDHNLTNPEAMRMMQLINIAYQNLSDPSQREAHDLWIREQQAGEKKPDDSDAAEPPADPKTEKARADAQAWATLAEKTAKEAQQAREKAQQAAAKAQAAPERDKAKWNALAQRAAEDAKEAKAKADEALASAREAAQKAGIALTPKGTKATTHYAVLKLTVNAPPEVIRAAYKTLAQKFAAQEQQAQPDTAGFVQALNEAYKILNDPQKKAAYDAQINEDAPGRKKEKPEAPLTMRETSEREKELNAAAERAEGIAKAKIAMAERAREEAHEAAEQARQAAETAKHKANDKDAAKWKAWADKLADAAVAAKSRVPKAVAEAEAAQTAAKESAARAAAEKAQADKLAAADAETAARNRAIREAAERAEREKQGQG
ncbi:MAG: DnaJ domain-containing protein [Alphaproteobacteria bacterium]|nr:DnaJ domain-containing protein [Alphaproteobacteria bacterium]